MYLRTSVRVVAAAAALTLAAAVPALAETELPVDPEISVDGDGVVDDTDDDGVGVTLGEVEPAIQAFALPAEPTTITIANITDFHGRIAASSGDVVNTGPGVRLACYVEDNPAAILTSSGDNIGATPFISSAQNDYPTIEVLNAVGLQVSALGNHELDRGWDDFDAKAAVMDFSNLAANVSGGRSSANVGDYEIITVDGIDVAFIGAVTEELPSLITPSHLDGITLSDIADSVNSLAADLTDGEDANGEADVVVALIHEDMSFIVNQLQNVDLAFGGHSHVMYNNGSPEPLLAMQSIQYGEAISQVDVTVNPDGSIEFEAAVLGLLPAQGSPLTPYRNDCAGAISTEVRSIVQDAKEQSDVIGAQELGYISGDFNRAQGINPASGAREENRGEESTVGNMVADAQLWAVQQTAQYADTQLAFMNPGGLRTDLKYDEESGGVVTLGQAAAMQPFANSLFTMTLSGRDVVDALNEQLQPATASRPYLKLGVAGLAYEYDPVTFQVTEVWLDSGEPLDLDGSYRVVVNSFLQAGGDNFPAFLNGTNVNDTGIIDLDAFVDFMAANAPESAPLDPSGDLYGAQRSWGFADGSEVNSDDIESGQVIDLDYAGLWFTTGETSNAQELTVLFDGELLGAFPVTGDDEDLEIKKTNYGRASVSASIPDLSGYGDGDEVSFVVLAGNTVLTDWVYTISGSTDPTEPTDSTDPTKDPTTPGTDTPTGPEKTPDTGANVGGPLLAGMLLLGVGTTFLGIRRKMLA